MVILKLTETDWRRYRDIRLRALQDTPDAFASTYADESGFSEQKWRERLSGAAVTFLAENDGTDVGMATGAPYVGKSGTVGLFGMWVAPSARRLGCGVALVGAVVGWACETGFGQVALDVADQNAAAIALYRRAGFNASGATGALPPPRSHVTEHEMVLKL